MVSLSRKFILICSISGLFLGLPTVASTATAEPSEPTKVHFLIQKLGSDDKREAREAASELKGYHYREVVNSLILTVMEELGEARPDFEVIDASLNSLRELATKADVDRLKDIAKKINFVMKRGGDPQLKDLIYDVARVVQAADFRKPASNQVLTKQLEPAAKSQNKDQQNRVPLRQRLREAAYQRTPGAGEAAKVLLAGTSVFMSDELLEQLTSGEIFEIFGRDQEVAQAIDTLTREKGKNPILVGPRGSGKTKIVEKIAQTILENKLPDHPVFQNELAGAYVIETSPAQISRLAMSNDPNSQAAALEMYFESILTLERELGLRIILFIDEIHTLGSAQVEAMKRYLDSRTKGVKLIGASTSVEYQNAFKHNPAIQRRFDTIGVPEQSAAEVKAIIIKVEVPRAEKRYSFEIPEETVDAIVQNANRVYPDTSLVDAAGKMLMTLCSSQARHYSPGPNVPTLVLSEKMVYQFVQDKMGYPVNPLDVKALSDYRSELLNRLNDDVIGQERMVGDVVEEWIRLLKNNRKGVRTVIALGPTGVGKSHLGRQLAKLVFGTEGAFMEVDGNQFKEGHFSNNTFFGAPNGVMSSNKTSGMLFDYLDDPGRGKFGGIIMINEAERAHKDFWEKMMEIMDTGKGVGGDGKERILGRHLIILTSNRGDVSLYPKTIEDWTDAEYRAHMATLNEERLKQVFKEASSGRDEFRLPDPILARIDKYTAAEPMLPAKVERVAIQKAQSLIKLLEDRFKIQIEFDTIVASEIALASYQKGLGVRPVEKKIVDLIEGALDRYLIESELKRGDKLQVGLALEASGASSIEVRGPSGVMSLPIPKEVKHDLLSDQELMQRLEQLDQELNQRVFGQQDMIKRIKDAVISHQTSRGQRPLSIFAVGSTGTGKSEMARALARALYQSEKRVLELDMGQIIYEGELSNIFGSPVGHTGSTEERVFEQFLRENPHGGVIVFDEISNMGGKDPAQKEALFKKFYSIFENGKWLSPATNKVYDLSKYTIINTGNDLEALLQGVSADDLRMSIWKQFRNPQMVRELLVKSGVPEAFLGRMDDVFLMKPLLNSEVQRIVNKILAEQIKEFSDKGLQIFVEQTFYKDVADIFFSHAQGARSIRGLIERRMKSAITQLIMEAKGIENLKGKEIYLLVRDNQVKRTYIKGSDPERKVYVYAIANPGPEQFGVTLEVTEYAVKINLQSKQEVIRTSYHEAGHAVANDPKVTGQKIGMITVVGRDGYLGYARYESVQGASTNSMTEEKTIRIMARLLAGQIAEKLAGFEENAGWASDLEKARALATKYILEWGLGRNMASVPLDDKGRPKLRGDKERQFQKEMDRLFAEADKMATATVKSNWNLVRAVVGELYQKGEITGQRYKELELQLAKKPAAPKWERSENSKKLTRVPSSSAVNRCEAVFAAGF